MTTAAPTPQFPTTPRGHPALRATVILGLCGALIAGFVAVSSQLPFPGSSTGSATSIACDGAAAGRHTC